MKAWITRISKDEIWPIFWVEFEERSNYVEVTLTPLEVKLVRRYIKTSAEYNSMCQELLCNALRFNG